ncbi:hypothetical protein ACIBKY_51135 [Nonomuraea sp. NPDC050394]|uniref:hypothetical protein n=1 Tax=Nonomuraea sp. NPDC050394 TaxID=3364363 RepID=UPI0037B88596
MAEITFSRSRHWPVQAGGDVVVVVGRRWMRAAIYFGQPPGSRIGVWVTRADRVRGVNVRVGKRYIRCLTILLHTQRLP